MKIKSDSVISMLGRVFWIMFGPMLLGAGVLLIVLNPGTGWGTRADIMYLATLVLMIVGRSVEHLGDHPETSTGEPSAPADLRRYITFMLIGGLAVWAVANLIANYMLV